MDTTKKISIRIPHDRYTESKEKAEKLNMTYSEYVNNLIQNDLRDNGIILNQRKVIRGMSLMSTYINHLAGHYPGDEDVRGLKTEVRAIWGIL